MRMKLSWVLIGMALLVLIFAIMSLIDISRHQVDEVKPVVFLSVPTREVRLGEDFVTSIYLQNAVEAYGSSISLVFDPLALELVTQNDEVITPGDFFAAQPSTIVANSVNRASGVIDYAIILRPPAEPVTGSGILGTARLRALRDSAVEIGVTEARLLPPQIVAIESQEDTTSFETIPVEVEAMRVDRNAEFASAPPSEEVVSVPSPSSDAEADRLAELVSRLGDRSSPGVAVGAVFFIIGLVLFLIGLRTYSRLYRRYAT